MTDRSAIVATRRRNPCATLQEIGDKYGVTKERIRQILKEKGEATRHWTARSAARTGNVCPSCGGWKEDISVRCLNCYRLKQRAERGSTLVPVSCDWCGKITWRYPAWVIRSANSPRHKGHQFCNRRCQGSWVGTNYGFGVRRRGGPGRPRTFDYDAAWALREAGHSGPEVARIMGISLPNVYNAWHAARRKVGAVT